jgi:hypothetical protein
MIRAAKLSYEKTGDLQPFAMTVGEGGKASQFASHVKRDVTETCRVLENGLRLMARQGNCTAVGLCPELGSEAPTLEPTEAVIFVEHRDGAAYRILFSLQEPKELNALRAEPRFFVGMGRNPRLAGRAIGRTHRWFLKVSSQ